jgi:cytochrome d ubiquinol oxidase subunit II
METLWFCLLALLLAGYVLLDGYDLGVGALHLSLARSDKERRQSLAAIAPFWDANEVWLITAGGTLFFSFPRLYASSFSGFYLPLMIVLWLLIVRGISIEFRNHLESPTWAPIWDAGFAFASALLIIFFGVALGNLLRGVPLDSSGEFFIPLWTDFRLGSEIGILDWYTTLTGIFALGAICLHGALWLNFKVAGVLQERARRLMNYLVPLVAVLAIAVTAATFEVQPHVRENLASAPWGWLLPLGAGLGLAGCILQRERSALGAFLSSSIFLLCMLGSAAFALYPYVLPSSGARDMGLTIYNSNPGIASLKFGLWWWIPGMCLAAGYTVFTHRHFSEKIAE